jgi:hypothetical protein
MIIWSIQRERRKFHNGELHDLYSSNITDVIKSLGMGNEGNFKSIRKTEIFAGFGRGNLKERESSNRFLTPYNAGIFFIMLGSRLLASRRLCSIGLVGWLVGW